ncbi:hypothetical protein [Streptomyces sp. URMC 129]|uniref:hypothetical protein n=1 Tax=Streptomyces sp. URMC 129 TaxID=3423407 RepID=UPI003F1A6070
MQTSTQTVIRSAIQWTVSVAVMLPGIVAASGVPDTMPWVAGGLAVAAGVTRVMQLPDVQAALDRLGLSTAPPEPPPPAGLGKPNYPAEDR